MGCSQSKNVAVDETTQPQPSGNAASSMQPAPNAAPSSGAIGGSGAANNPAAQQQQQQQQGATAENDPTHALPVRQRRRLSVTGELVGDITEEPQQDVKVKRRFSMLGEQHLSLGAALPSSGDNMNPSQIADRIYAAVSKKGYVPYNSGKVNQDAFFVECPLDGNDYTHALFGVCDGHGEFGHVVAQYVARKLPDYIRQHDYQSQPKNAILKGVAQVVNDLDSSNDINTTFSGTTLVFSLILGDRIYTANLGDSRAVLYQSNENVSLSIDQKPDNPEEKKRILSAGGRVEPLPGPPEADTGPDRVWLKEVDVPGLAMSRSIGDDVAHSVGVSSIPEILEYDCRDDDTYVVWASDGVWEFLSNSDTQKILFANNSSIQSMCHSLAERSIQQWKKEEEVIDDITAVVLDLKHLRQFRDSMIMMNQQQQQQVPPPLETSAEQ